MNVITKGNPMINAEKFRYLESTTSKGGDTTEITKIAKHTKNVDV